jgi:hypothetical protein
MNHAEDDAAFNDYVKLFDNSWTEGHIVTQTVLKVDAQYANSKEYMRAANTRHRADKIKRTPPWSEKERIKFVYILAERASQVYGIQFDVDHIIPLKGKRVSGLHCLDNLQILEHRDNVMKSNTFDPENIHPKSSFSIFEWLQKHTPQLACF